MEKPETLLTIEDVASEFNLKCSWLRKAVSRGQIPHLKLKHLIRFRRADLERWLSERQRGARR